MFGLVTGRIGMSAYAASKHAANAFSTVLRLELKGFGIQVTTVNPSFHGTPLINTIMGDVTTRIWETLDPVKKKEYGEGKKRVLRDSLSCMFLMNAPEETDHYIFL